MVFTYNDIMISLHSKVVKVRICVVKIEAEPHSGFIRDVNGEIQFYHYILSVFTPYLILAIFPFFILFYYLIDLLIKK